MAKDKRKICIVLDTNVWFAQRMLRVGLGASLLHTVVELDAAIGLPEVVDQELKPKWQQLARESLESATEVQRVLSAMAGEEVLMTLPTEEQLVGNYDKRLKDLAPWLVLVPLSLDHARRALERINKHLPPSGKNNEQFRDTAIWEAVLELASTYDVHFITEDGAFFAERDPKKEAKLAPNLVEDCKNARGPIYSYRNIRDCLTALKQEVKALEEWELIGTIIPEISKALNEDIAPTEFALGEPQHHSFEAFETGEPVLALSYTLTFALQSTRPADSDRLDARLVTTGECAFNPKTKTVSDIRRVSAEITWIDASGKKHRVRRRDQWEVFRSILASIEFKSAPIVDVSNTLVPPTKWEEY